jgi:hypothetical protein
MDAFNPRLASTIALSHQLRPLVAIYTPKIRQTITVSDAWHNLRVFREY